MFKSILRYLLFIGAFAIICDCSTRTNHTETDLIRYLMLGYEKRARPTNNLSETVEVMYDLKLIEIQNVDERDQKLSVFAWQAMIWKDINLEWNPDNFSGIQRIVLPAKNVWLPDLVQENNALEFYNEQFTKYFQAEVFYTGEVLYSPGGRFTTSCSLNMRKFPFDRQTCEIIVTVWTRTCSEVELFANHSKVNLENYNENSEWNLEDTDVVKTRRSGFDEYDYCSLKVTLKIKRKPLYFVIIVVLPCILLSFISIISFLIPSEGGERISMCMTVMLSFTVFLLVLNDILPRNSDEAPIIALYIIIIMVVMSISLVCTVLIVKLHYKNSRVPPKLKYFVFKIMGRFVGMKYGNKTVFEVNKDPSSSRSSDWRKIAAIFDRFCIIIFTLSITIITLVMFAILPFTN
ncbi:DgyrCDS1008 [Dimorphilus gyrociliatus]|uniref:DgyrCDS1008 n=1 Tax=Dimorphilus gyrociliatus TaxID=2664684 RepID=A0A7I8V808_9ANNE|nr:DgyrCDS1008 [Dimorphilus gyrociliatus]